MKELLSSGHVVDMVLVVLVLEMAGLALFRMKAAAPGKLGNLVFAALPGVFLLLALRAAVSGAGWGWMALWLTASFPAHLADLWRRPP